MSIENCDNSLWGKVMDAKDPLNWVLLGFPAGEKKKVEVVGSGTGGRAELVSNLKEDQVMYGGFVVYGVDDRGGVQSRRGKFCFVCYVGPSVKIMMKARVTSQKGAIKQYFCSTHVDFAIDDPEDLSEEEVTHKLLACGGAHKPKYYDFGGASGEAAKNEKRRGTLYTGDQESIAALAAAHAGKGSEEAEQEVEAATRRASQAMVKMQVDVEQATRIVEHTKAAEENEALRKASVEEAKKAADEEQANRVAESAAADEAAEKERTANARAADEAADEEQYQRIVENAIPDEEAAKEREANVASAKKAAQDEQERRAEDKGGEAAKQEGARRLSGVFNDAVNKDEE